MRTILTFMIMTLTSVGFSQNKDVDIDYMVYTPWCVSASIEDSIKGIDYEKGMGVVAKKIKDRKKFPKKSVSLLLDEKVISLYNNYNGYKLYIANTTGKDKKVYTDCGTLYVTTEAYIDNIWQPIEEKSIIISCEFTYEILKAGYYWEFHVPKFTGEIETKIRYGLFHDGAYIYSNEIDAHINRGQLSNKGSVYPEWEKPLEED